MSLPSFERIRRINVTGNAGAGKSTLAIELGQQLSLPVYHLDSIVWQPHWRKTPQPLRLKLEQAITEQEAWIIDGVSKHVRSNADLVVLLDTPRHICLWRAFKRNLPYLFRSRPGLPEKCPEILIVPTLLRMIIRFPKLVRTEIVREASTASKYLRVRSRTDLRDLLHQLKQTESI